MLRTSDSSLHLSVSCWACSHVVTTLDSSDTMASCLCRPERLSSARAVEHVSYLSWACFRLFDSNSICCSCDDSTDPLEVASPRPFLFYIRMLTNSNGNNSSKHTCTELGECLPALSSVPSYTNYSGESLPSSSPLDPQEDSCSLRNFCGRLQQLGHTEQWPEGRHSVDRPRVRQGAKWQSDKHRGIRCRCPQTSWRATDTC